MRLISVTILARIYVTNTEVKFPDLLDGNHKSANETNATKHLPVNSAGCYEYFLRFGTARIPLRVRYLNDLFDRRLHTGSS